MATTFITGIDVRPGRTPLQTAFDSISYITNPKKTRNGELVSSFRCIPNSAHFEMMFEQRDYEQKTGRKVIQDYGGKKKSYLLMTIRQSFAPGEVTPEQAHTIGCELAKQFLKDKYQYVVATHIDKHCIHNHITFNIVGSDMKKFHQTKYTPRHLRDLSDRLCMENNLSVVVPSEWQKRRYANEKNTPFRTMLKNDIDRCIREAQDYEDFIRRMQEQYYVDDTGKYLKFRHRTNGQQRPIRSYTLGKGYSWHEIHLRCEIDEEIINPLTFSQKLRNIEAMIHAAGYIREHGDDFEKQSENLKEAMEQTQSLMEEMQRKLTQTESIVKCFGALDQYQPIYEQYSSGLLTEQGMRKHENEIGLYRAALEALKERHIQPDSAVREKFRAELSDIQTASAELDVRYHSAREQLRRVDEVRNISERVEADDPIITTKKGGKQYDR